MVSKFGGNIETETGTARAHGDTCRGIESSLAEFAPDFSWQSWAKITHADSDFIASVSDREYTGGVVVGIMNGVRAKVIDDAMEEVVIGNRETRAVIVSELELAIFVAEKWTKLMSDFVAEIAHAERLHFEKSILEASNFGEIVDLAHSAFGDADELRLDMLASRLVVDKIKRKGKLAHKGERRF